MSSHKFKGTGEETQVDCPKEGVLKVSDSTMFNPEFCPYCGETVSNSDHRVDTDICEVFCENTIQSTWRFCPLCGVRKEK